MDVQWTLEDLLLKLDGAKRWGQGRAYYSLATGVEYSIYDFNGSDGQMGLIVEYTRNNRSRTAPPTIYNNDLFLGVRWQNNDVNSTEMLVSSLIDLEKNSQLYKLTWSRRLNDYFKLDLEGAWLGAMSKEEPIAYLEKESYLEASLKYFF